MKRNIAGQECHDASQRPRGPDWYRPLGGGLLPDCEDCRAHLAAYQAGIMHACASVGIEHGYGTLYTLVRYIGYYHRAGHPQL